MITRSVLRSGVDVLRDGSTVSIRPVEPTDEANLLGLFQSFSSQSKRFRFFTATPNLAAIAREECTLSPDRGFGIVATRGADGAIVGHASFRLTTPACAEVDFAVSEAFRGRGLATLLLARLAEAAANQGVTTFEAEMVPANHRMLEVFRESGFPMYVTTGPETIELTFPTQFTPEAIERFERREQIAATSALQTFLHPASVAVIGASRRRETPGGEIFHNLLAAELASRVYAVNSAADAVQGVRAYASIEAIPEPVDLAVVAVPCEQVVDVASQCARKNVRALVVISAGFAEVGAAGRKRQADLLSVCRAAGMRLIGPNCFGIVNTDPAVRLNATFAPIPPREGRVGFLSQSGALGLAAIDYAAARGLGISSFVSVGNRADISSNDLLNYWATDPQTDVMLLYLESFGNPRKFARIARRVGKTKPVVAVKSGRSVAGARATSSHTGALLAASDVTVDALFRQAGVIRTDTLEELFDVAILLASQPAPGGRRVGIVTNAGGPGILCADACEAAGLQVPLLAEQTQALLRGFLPLTAGAANPVDMIATATGDQYRRAITAIAADPQVDAVIAIFIRPFASPSDEVADAILDAARRLNRSKPVLAVLMSRDMPLELRAADVVVPTYAFPEAAAIALSHAARYAEWRRAPVRTPPALDGLRRDEAAALIARALGRGAEWLEADELAELLGCYGLGTVEQRTAPTPRDAAVAAELIGGPVVLKGLVPGVVHKTDAGLVRLDLQEPDQVQEAASEMAKKMTADGRSAPTFVVQRMAPRGIEMIVGLVHDPTFGPVVACGAGGVLVELLKDVAVRLTPLAQEDASEMLRGLKTFPLLDGYRGGPVYDTAALEDILLRASAMAEDLPPIAELDLNPIVVLDQGALILDARARLLSSEEGS